MLLLASLRIVGFLLALTLTASTAVFAPPAGLVFNLIAWSVRTLAAFYFLWGLLVALRDFLPAAAAELSDAA